MRTIWKYELNITDSQALHMPEGAKILCVQAQNGIPCLWAEVNTNSPDEERIIEIFGTGHSMYFDTGVDREYISTFQIRGGALVFHAYERKGL